MKARLSLYRSQFLATTAGAVTLVACGGTSTSPTSSSTSSTQSEALVAAQESEAALD